MPYKERIAHMAALAVGISENEVFPFVQIPKKEGQGDFSLPCFVLAKVLGKEISEVTKVVCEATLPEGIQKVEVSGGYVNFYVDPLAYTKDILLEALEAGMDYGKKNLGRGRKVCIDYSSINIAKPFHIGHLSSTAIGHALYNLYNFMGYESIGINHLGDWGTQFGKLIWAYKRWSSREQVLDGGIDHMLELYVRFHEEAEKHPEMEEEARSYFVAIENGEPEAHSIFQLFTDLTLREIMHLYDLLGISFDSYAGESFYNDKMESVLKELGEKNLLKESDGALIVDLEVYGMAPCMIQKSDGATLYATRDIAAALYRKRTYDFAKCLYVVAYQQNLHFRQLFKVIELMGCAWARDMEHVAFGMVSLADGGTLSTRRGNVVKLEDVIHTAIEKAEEIMKEKSPHLMNRTDVAKQVGVGAVVFGVLYNARIKDISFDYEQALNFNGETAPYLQYTHARCCSLLGKAIDMQEEPDFAALSEQYAQAVLKATFRYQAALVEALGKNEPYLLSRALMELCKEYNRFYYAVRILDPDDPRGASARCLLTRAVRDIVRKGLWILGIAAPEEM